MTIFRSCALAVAGEVGDPGHRPVLVHDLADHAGRDQAGEPRQVDARLGVAGALERPAVLRLQREDVAGDVQVVGAGVRVDRDLDRARAVVGGDPGGDPLAASIETVNAVCSGASFLAVIRFRPSSSQRLRGQRQADQPAAVRGHEVDRLRRRELRRHHQVALVLAVLAVADDDHPPAADLLDRLLDRREGALLGGLARSSPAGSSRSAPISDGCEASQQALGVASHHVDLDVDGSPGDALAERRALQRLGDQRYLDGAAARAGRR